MPKVQSPDNSLPLTPPVFHILLALAEEERHGYGIMQDVARQTDDALQLGPGPLRLSQEDAGSGIGGGVG